jgi:hypothetical protein
VESNVTELRVYLPIESLARQFAAYMATPMRARGYPPMEGEHSLIIEVAPALAIHRICDLALKSSPDMEPGLLYVERQYGLLELHHSDLAALRQAGQAILGGIGRKAGDQLKPRTLFADIIENVADQHAIILNRTREASMLLPGKSLLVYELEPALFATVAANEAEKAAPGITLIDLQMIGASGRLFIAGTTRDCELARDRIDEVLGAIEGRQSGR